VIVTYDLWAMEYQHYEFNLNFIKLLLLLYNEEIVHYGSQSQIEYLKSDLRDFSGFSAFPIDVITSNGLFIKNFKIVVNAINIILHDKPLVVKYYALISYPVILIGSKLKLCKKNTTFVLHGLEVLINPTSSKFKKIYYKICIAFPKTKNYHYLVLGDRIRKNLVKLIPSINNNLVAIDHPYSEKKMRNTNHNYQKIKIACIGWGIQGKGIDDFNNLVSKYYNNNHNLIEFYYIGKLENDVIIDQRIILPFPGNKFVPKDEYEQMIAKMNCILFLFPVDSYKLTASGSLLEAVSFNLPIIALKNEYFNEVFEKSLLKGFLFDSVDEIYNFISSLRDGTERVNLCVNKTAIKYFSSESIAKRLLESGNRI